MQTTARPTKICFSGFMRDKRDALKKRAVEAGMVPVGTVSRNLDYLVVGPYCEPKVRARASDCGISVVEVDDLERLLAVRAKTLEISGESRIFLAVGQKLPLPSGVLVAIDFETADRGRDGACSVALIRFEDGTVTSRAYSLIRPPRRQVEFTPINGLSWEDLADERSFAEVWNSLRHMYHDADYFIAHNAVLQKAGHRSRDCCRPRGVFENRQTRRHRRHSHRGGDGLYTGVAGREFPS